MPRGPQTSGRGGEPRGVGEETDSGVQPLPQVRGSQTSLSVRITRRTITRPAPPTPLDPALQGRGLGAQRVPSCCRRWGPGTTLRQPHSRQ